MVDFVQKVLHLHIWLQAKMSLCKEKKKYIFKNVETKFNTSDMWSFEIEAP